jgi:hypothetical protein
MIFCYAELVVIMCASCNMLIEQTFAKRLQIVLSGAISAANLRYRFKLAEYTSMVVDLNPLFSIYLLYRWMAWSMPSSDFSCSSCVSIKLPGGTIRYSLANLSTVLAPWHGLSVLQIEHLASAFVPEHRHTLASQIVRKVVDLQDIADGGTLGQIYRF